MLTDVRCFSEIMLPLDLSSLFTLGVVDADILQIFLDGDASCCETTNVDEHNRVYQLGKFRFVSGEKKNKTILQGLDSRKEFCEESHQDNSVLELCRAVGEPPLFF